MKAIIKIYRIGMASNETWGDEFYLETRDGESFRPHDLYGKREGAIILSWMTKIEMIAWLRKAADTIEQAEFN